eukprot:gene5500-11078_t
MFRILRSRSRVAIFQNSHWKRYFSALPSTNENAFDVSSEQHASYKFESFFRAPDSLKGNINLIPEGSYIDVAPGDIDKYFPEGLAGDALKEFEFTGHKMWMVRDVSKLLCGLIDEFQTGTDIKEVDRSETITKSFRLPIEVEGLTNRPEWKVASMNLKYYGRDFYCSHLKEKFIDLEQIQNSNETNVKKYLNCLKTVGMPKHYLLAGPRGVGKSICLNQMVLHARKQGWICLFIPNAWDHVYNGIFIEPCSLGSTKGLYDNLFITVAMLRNFWKAHNDILFTLPIQKTKELEKYKPFLAKFREAWTRAKSMAQRQSYNFIQLRAIIEDEDNFPDEDELDEEIFNNFDFNKFEIKSIGDLILMGIAFRDLAGTCVTDIIEELKIIENHKVLIAIDQYNTWGGPTIYNYGDKKIMANDLCVPKALHCISKTKAITHEWNLKNGLVVCATSYKHPQGLKTDFKDELPSVPVTIQVPVYSQIEYLAAMKYYISLNRVQDMFSTQEFLAYRMHCASNPSLLRSQLVPYFFPLSMQKYSGDFIYYPGAKEILGDYDTMKSDEDDET